MSQSAAALENELTFTRFDQMCDHYPDKSAVIYLGQCFSYARLRDLSKRFAAAMLDLGVKMGYPSDFWNGSMEEAMNYQLQPFKMSIDDLRKHQTGIEYELLPRKYENYDFFFNMKSARPISFFLY